ncbi:sulfurtransferase [Sulfurimonas sediminis]|uniref:Sulfurtransferase n=1 Tax=Sulfurimonas sediminis TaxID=2590020 RepID=A0A7M1B4D2_9BACT|nr:rhodanese-like domain-containing protein [Sulfurimonas sediminis]QOP44386.1 sulfurtransferase [Sulfurimonas sediminis]
MKKLFLIITLLSTNLLMADIANKMVLIKEARKVVGEMPAKQLKTLLDEGEDVIVLDVRESEQRAEGDIPYDEFNKENFIAITRGNLEWKVAQKIKDPDALIVTFCRSGGRGALAAEVLRKMGYKHATTLKGGLKGWVKAGYPVKTGLGELVLTKQ